MGVLTAHLPRLRYHDLPLVHGFHFHGGCFRIGENVAFTLSPSFLEPLGFYLLHGGDSAGMRTVAAMGCLCGRFMTCWRGPSSGGTGEAFVQRLVISSLPAVLPAHSAMAPATCRHPGKHMAPDVGLAEGHGVQRQAQCPPVIQARAISPARSWNTSWRLQLVDGFP